MLRYARILAHMGQPSNTWTGPQIQAFRRLLGEDYATFAARFARSPRTIEKWEQGRSVPDALVIRHLNDLRKKVVDTATPAA